MDRTISKGESGWDRMYRIWVGENRPGTVVLGEDHYVVMTPNGEEEPIFSLQGSGPSEFYSSVSMRPGKDTKRGR